MTDICFKNEGHVVSHTSYVFQSKVPKEANP